MHNAAKNGSRPPLPLSRGQLYQFCVPTCNIPSHKIYIQMTFYARPSMKTYNRTATCYMQPVYKA